MSRLWSVLVAGLLVVPAIADDAVETDPCVTELTAEKLDNPPERKTKFERVEDAWKQRLVDVKVADQKYAALVRVVLPNSQGKPFEAGNRNENYGRRAGQLLPEAREIWNLQVFFGRLLLHPDVRVDDPSLEETRAPFKRILAQVPADRLPPDERLILFTSPNVTSLVSFSWGRPRSSASSPTNATKMGELDFQLLANSPEQAEQRAATLLTILDQGFSRPIQLALFKERVRLCGELSEAREKANAGWKEYQTINTKIKEYEEFTPDMLSGLRVQQLQMEVDLAGVKARLETCERLLAKLPRDSERRKQIEDAKIAAEIELSGFEARRAKAAEFVTKVKERNETQAKLNAASGKAGLANRQRDNLTKAIQQIDEEIEAFGPVRLVDDRVTIHPLEWVQ